jgi:hypothetical protein
MLTVAETTPKAPCKPGLGLSRDALTLLEPLTPGKLSKRSYYSSTVPAKMVSSAWCWHSRLNKHIKGYRNQVLRPASASPSHAC